MSRRKSAKERVLAVLSDCHHPKFNRRWRIATSSRTWADAAKRLRRTR
jgi:hypothetical protein